MPNLPCHVGAEGGVQGAREEFLILLLTTDLAKPKRTPALHLRGYPGLVVSFHSVWSFADQRVHGESLGLEASAIRARTPKSHGTLGRRPREVMSSW